MSVKSFEYERIFIDMVEQNHLNLFLGAGFSTYAKNENGDFLPLGYKINETLKECFDIKSKRNLTLSQTCQKIKLNHNDTLCRILRTTYKVKEFDLKYLKINRLPIKNIISTNIDDLIEKIFSHSDSKVDISDVNIEGYIDKSNIINYFKLHGSVTYPIESRLSFTEQELHSLFSQDHTLFSTVSYKMASSPCLFWGTSLSDSNTIQLLSQGEEYNKIKMPKWIVVYPEEGYEELVEEYHEKGFYVIVSDTLDLIDYLDNLPLSKISNDDKYIYHEYRDTFPNNYVCKELVKKSLARPVTDFFQGAEPQISDIKSVNVKRTSYFAKAFNLVLKNKITLITGIPGCGKSTLLLQLALANEVSGRKFWFNGMIESEAKRLANLVSNDTNVTVFMDNLYSNLDAFNVLKEYSNIRLVTTERTLNFEFVKNSLSIESKSILDISDLNIEDIHTLCSAMNKSSQDAMNLIKINANVSLLEIVFYSYKSITVKERITEYIRALQNYHNSGCPINLLELYALVNYISYCGTSTSMDMLYFYFSCEINSYEDILLALRKMNSILVEINMSDDDYVDNQDYVIMRSKLYSEVSLFLIPKHILSKVLFDFHERVSNSIIYRYDIFKKRAYDADITTKAFDKQAGIQFYESLIRKNVNPYLRHQYALFLQRKRDFDLAWTQIDKAYTDCNGKIFTIANSHAIILFEKNINIIPINDQHKRQLQEIINRTFDTLEYCITRDVKVNYHVLIYSRNAIEYYQKFGYDENSKRFILNANIQMNLILHSTDFIYRKLRSQLIALQQETKEIMQIHNFNDLEAKECSALV
ncbi:SIR2 family protein (plasmid) [Oscillospiraceae bacterium MB08-C2-2]|nr:SIR2 family protein [Oscillospiraceae bacterium MB08-C2-2]